MSLVRGTGVPSIVPRWASVEILQTRADIAGYSVDLAEALDGKGPMHLSKYWLQNEARIHLHYRLRPGLPDDCCEDYCAIIRVEEIETYEIAVVPGARRGKVDPPAAVGRNVEVTVVADPSAVVGQRSPGDQGGYEKPMFVDVRVVTEHGEGVTRRFLAPCERLIRLHYCSLLGGHVLGRVGDLLPILGGVVLRHREVQSSDRHLAARRDPPDQRFEACANGVKNLSDKQAEFAPRLFAHEPDQVLGAVGVELSDEKVRIYEKRPGQFRLDQRQALICVP